MERSPSQIDDITAFVPTAFLKSLSRVASAAPPELDEHVPEALAELLCNSDCVVTHEFSPIEPDVFARGVRLIQERVDAA